MQDNSYINKIVSGHSFEELEESLQGRIIELKEAYRIKAPNEYAKGLKNDIGYLIQQLEKTIKLPDQKEKLQKQIRRYTILINIGKIVTGPELDKLLGDTPSNKFEKETLTLDEEILKNDYTIKALRDSVSIEIKENPYKETSKEDKGLESAVKQLEGTLIRKDLYEKLKLLKKDFYGKGKLNEDLIKELRRKIKEAKENSRGFEDIENSLNLFIADVLKD